MAKVFFKACSHLRVIFRRFVACVCEVQLRICGLSTKSFSFFFLTFRMNNLLNNVPNGADEIEKEREREREKER